MLYATAPNADGTPHIGEIRKAVRVTTTTGSGWDATYRNSYYWTAKQARAKHPRLTKPGGGWGMRSTTVTSARIRVVWDGKRWRLLGSPVRPQ